MRERRLDKLRLDKGQESMTESGALDLSVKIQYFDEAWLEAAAWVSGEPLDS
jgi:hypothetical protein